MTNQLRFNRRVLSATTTYIVFPGGQHYDRAEDALANKGAGHIREYTTIVRDITIIVETGETKKATGTVVQSKSIETAADVTPAPLPEEDLPF